MAAALTNAAISAPVKPFARSASLSKSTVLSIGFFVICILRISFIASLSGAGTSQSRSNRPGLNKA
ncbi:MAG TPA: hypothetical protein VN703_03560, partial [Candidatus Sulfopaludibacter sp.]|nr:hypothetical protein [Candidatus Sulfopaludibacter sp.]